MCVSFDTDCINKWDLQNNQKRSILNKTQICSNVENIIVLIEMTQCCIAVYLMGHFTDVQIYLCVIQSI